MIKNYISTKEKISEALNDIDSFMTLMGVFNEKHGKLYTYEIDIKEILEGKDKWSISLTLNRDGKE